MKDPEQELREEKRKRRRIAKKWLRWLPRRATVHRYPGLSRFAGFARRFPEIWSFRKGPVLRAIWAGSLLTFAPLFGIQILTSLFLSILFRANLPLMVALMFITNQFTLIPIYLFNYFIGNWFLGLFDGRETHGELTRENLTGIEGGLFSQFINFFKSIDTMTFVAIGVGGLVIGALCGLILHGAYWLVVAASRRRVRFLEEKAKLERERREEAEANPSRSSSASAASRANGPRTSADQEASGYYSS